MSHNLSAVKRELNHMANDARALFHATADVAEDNVAEARARVSAAVKKGGRAWNRARHSALRGVRGADHTIREHPYCSLGIALGVGALLGFLASRRY